MLLIRVSVKANAVHDNGNGTFVLEIPGVELKHEDFATLQRLFPNLQEKAMQMLNHEALLASLASEADIVAPPKKSKQAVSPMPQPR